MRPPSRRFFFLDAFFFSFRLRLSPRSDETFLYRPTFANIARCYFGYPKSIINQQYLARDGGFSKQTYFVEEEFNLLFQSREGERYIYIYIYRRSIILDRLRDEIAVRGDTKERYQCRGENMNGVRKRTRETCPLHTTSPF